MSNIAKIVVDGHEFSPGGGGGDLELLNSGTLSGTITISNVSLLRRGIFMQNGSDNSIPDLNLKLPDTTQLYNNGGYFLFSNLKTISLPVLTTIVYSSGYTPFSSNYVGIFAYAQRLESLSLPLLTSLEYCAYFCYSCTSLTSVNIPLANSGRVGNDMFYGCTSLTSVNIPNLQYLAEEIFRNCTSLTSVEFKKITNPSGSYAFYGCTSLVSAKIYNDDSSVNVYWQLGSYAFSGCTSLTSVEVNCTSFYQYAFQNCSALTSIKIRRSNSMASVANTTNVFPINANPIVVYVPSSLKATYEANTNWASWVSQGAIVFADLID